MIQPGSPSSSPVYADDADTRAPTPRDRRTDLRDFGNRHRSSFDADSRTLVVDGPVYAWASFRIGERR
jgi:hypothetical protein